MVITVCGSPPHSRKKEESMHSSFSISQAPGGGFSKNIPYQNPLVTGGTLKTVSCSTALISSFSSLWTLFPGKLFLHDLRRENLWQAHKAASTRNCFFVSWAAPSLPTALHLKWAKLGNSRCVMAALAAITRYWTGWLKHLFPDSSEQSKVKALVRSRWFYSEASSFGLLGGHHLTVSSRDLSFAGTLGR